MQHVVFARDRRRKKNRLKVMIFLMAIISILIGIGLALKNDKASLPKNPPATAVFEDHALPNEEKKPSSVSEIIGTDIEANPINSELNYVDIDVNEAEDHDSDHSMTEDANATSYEDELTDKDDVDDLKPAMSDLTQPVVESVEDINIAIAQGDVKVEQPTQKPTEPIIEEDGKQEEIVKETAVLEEKIEEESEPVPEEKPRKPRHYSYTVTRGDKLRDVFEQSGIGASVAKAMERKFPQLANLEVGQQFHWQIDADGELENMSWLVSEKEEQIFERKAKNKFAVRVIEKKGVWKQDVVKGTISGNFVASMKNVGLADRQIQQLSNGLQWQIATNKLKKGDKFAILVKREYINGKVTELGNVEAIHVISGNKSYFAIQADNGRFYSRHGETLGKGFARYPLQFTPRVSSSFNPRRFHPVTKRLAPHKGVDFAVPTGTPIIAPADGVVEHIAYQANGAGRYIKLRHGGQYTTVYMHLSKQLVSVGQSVKKGDRIALSGNTGRSTGAHLHYEFHLNGNPVNPMTVKLPGTESGMPDNERKAFLAKAKSVEARLKL